jgi:hypothetical protein
LQCRWLRCAIEDSKSFSGGERIKDEAVFAPPGVRRGEGWPLRERKISWSMAYGI